MVFEVPMTLPSVANLREHWSARARRTKAQRSMTYLCCRNTIARGEELPNPPCVVRLIRQSPRALDTDNLSSAFKAVRDEVAKMLGVDDRHSEIVSYEYLQRRGKPMVIVQIHSRGGLE